MRVNEIQNRLQKGKNCYTVCRLKYIHVQSIIFSSKLYSHTSIFNTLEFLSDTLTWTQYPTKRPEVAHNIKWWSLSRLQQCDLSASWWQQFRKLRFWWNIVFVYRVILKITFLMKHCFCCRVMHQNQNALFQKTEGTSSAKSKVTNKFSTSSLHYWQSNNNSAYSMSWILTSVALKWRAQQVKFISLCWTYFHIVDSALTLA